MSYNGQNTFCSLKAFYVHLLDIQVSSYISLKNHFFFLFNLFLLLFNTILNPYTISTIIQFYLRYFHLNKLYLAYFQLYIQYLKKIYYAAITIFNVDQNKVINSRQSQSQIDSVAFGGSNMSVVVTRILFYFFIIIFSTLISQKLTA